MNNVVLDARGVSKTYLDAHKEVAVLRGVNLSVAAGECVAIQGSSGSGKSTLLHCLGGLDSVTSGEVFWNGKAIQNLSENDRSAMRNRHLGFVYQFHHLLNEFTAQENVAIPLLIRAEVTPAEAMDKAHAILSRVGLGARMKHKPGELSGGERQRVALARALVTDPACVLADEPTGNLDKKTAESVLSLMMELNSERKTSFIIVTHDPFIAKALGRVLHMEDGELK
ncbi:MAG: lipoprotein-releasing ABC transporter ATP-binding protein LolD [Gammaproteobacteria bacterium]